jgi:tetratricopeptide (TPR) repeat protein
MLQVVGRNRDAVEEYRRSTDVLSLDFDSQLGLADALLMAGKADEAKQHFDAAADLSSNVAVSDQIAIQEVPVTRDYAAALKALQNPKLEMPQALKSALAAAYRAMISGDPAAKAAAVEQLSALPPEAQRRAVVAMLAALGANGQAMQAVERKVQGHIIWSVSWLFLPAARGVLDDPAFPAFAQKLGLMTYWKSTHTRPDVCTVKDAPAFCRMI